MWYVYKHIRLDTNSVFYIGIGKRDKYRRARTIVRRNPHWKNIVAKTEWVSEIIFDNMTLEDAKNKEVELIRTYGRLDIGTGILVNMTDGGSGTNGHIVSELVKAKLSEINRGKVLSQDHKDKISRAHKGKKFSNETLEKMSAAKIGKKQSDDTINKRRIKLMGNKSNTGRKLSDSHRNNMSISQQKRRQRENEIL